MNNASQTTSIHHHCCHCLDPPRALGLHFATSSASSPRLLSTLCHRLDPWSHCGRSAHAHAQIGPPLTLHLGSPTDLYRALCYGEHSPTGSIYALLQSTGTSYNEGTKRNGLLAFVRILAGLVMIYVVVEVFLRREY